jgi:hypothetical protein
VSRWAREGIATGTVGLCYLLLRTSKKREGPARVLGAFKKAMHKTKNSNRDLPTFATHGNHTYFWILNLCSEKLVYCHCSWQYYSSRGMRRQYDAFIFTTAGDTLSGKIASPRLENGTEDKKMLQLLIVFEDSLGDKTDYRPGEIAGFSIRYRGAWMRYKVDSITTPNGVYRPFFLRIRSSGPTLTWLEFEYEVLNYPVVGKPTPSSEYLYYLIKPSGDWIKLTSNPMVSGGKKIKKFLSDCPAAVNRIQLSDDIVVDLPVITDLYHKCGN